MSDDLGTLSKRRFTSGGSQRALTPGQMKAPLHHMGVLPPLLLSPVTRSTVISSPLLSSVASFIAVLASPGVSFAGLPEFREALVQTLAALQEHAGVLAGQQRAGGGEEGMGEREEREAGEEGGEGVAGAGAEFVGALCDVVGSRDADSELRFACVSLLTDVVLTHLGAGADGGGAAGAGPLDAAIERYVLPLLPSLLEDRGSEMMPLNALKTIVALLECGPHWVPGVVALGLTPRFFSYLSLDSPNNNVHNMRICRALVIGGAVPLSKVASLEVVPRVMSVLSYAFDNSVEPFLEPVLDLCCSLLERDQHAAHEGIPGAGVTGPLVDALPVVVDLLRHPDVGVGSIAAEALSFLCEVHPGACGRMLLSREIGGALLDCLAADGAFSVPPAVQQGVLKALVRCRFSCKHRVLYTVCMTDCLISRLPGRQ